jgi:hypothetical protein
MGEPWNLARHPTCSIFIEASKHSITYDSCLGLSSGTVTRYPPWVTNGQSGASATTGYFFCSTLISPRLLIRMFWELSCCDATSVLTALFLVNAIRLRIMTGLKHRQSKHYKPWLTTWGLVWIYTHPPPFQKLRGRHTSSFLFLYLTSYIDRLVHGCDTASF